MTQDYTDSGALPGNTLAGQVVALPLSIGFDLYDFDFGESESCELRVAKITSGPFTGWQVQKVFAEAQKVLGGCDSEYDADEINVAVTAINESFADGTAYSGFLDAP